MVLGPRAGGLRRLDPQRAHPVLCIGEACYISKGADRAAQSMARPMALGPGNTLGQRAGACRETGVCIYRDVELGGTSAELQPVDMRLLGHDRREPVAAGIDPSCEVTGDRRLTCGRVAGSTTWRAWVVPEAVATSAGAKALSDAVNGGLAVRAAAAVDK